MGLFNKSADKKYKSASAQVRKIERKLENGIYSERKEERLNEKLARAKDDRYIARTQLKNPAPQHTTKKTSYSSTVNVNHTVNSKSVHFHGHVHKGKKK